MGLTRLRIVVLTGLGALMAVLAGRVFDAVQWEIVLVPVAIGAVALATLGRIPRLRTGVLVVTAVVAVGAAVILAGGSPSDVVGIVTRGLDRILATEWPSRSDPVLIGVVATIVAAPTTLAVAMCSNPKWHLAPLAVMLVGLVVLIALSAPVRPDPWLLLAVGVLSIVYAVSRDGEPTRSRWRAVSGDRSVAVALLALVITSVVASTALALDARADPRRPQEPNIVLAVLDAVEETVALRQADPPVALYTIEDRSTLIGQSLPARWRVAAFESYDGQRWVPRAVLRPIGRRLEPETSLRPGATPPIRYAVRFESDDTNLVPLPGQPRYVSVDVEVDLRRTVVRVAEQPEPGTSLTAEADVMASVPTESLPVTRPVDDLASTFTDQAGRLGGTGTVTEQIRRIESTMRTEWSLDPDAPGGGQQLALVERFVDETHRGTEEQFATAFVLLVRALGFDARLASGFVIDPDDLTTPLLIRSSDAAVWPEVHYPDTGWIAFDPVPPRTSLDDEDTPPPAEEQSPAAAQPPIPPPSESDPGDPDAATDDDGASSSTLTTWLVRSGAAAAAVVLPAGIVVGAILLIKRSRRRRRVVTSDPAAKIRGIWANATDSLVDAGLSVPVSWTDATIAEHAATYAPSVPHEIRRLAAMSTSATFGSRRWTGRDAEDAAAAATAVDMSIADHRTRWQRVAWRLSLRSLRPSTRSPVGVALDR